MANGDKKAEAALRKAMGPSLPSEKAKGEEEPALATTVKTRWNTTAVQVYRGHLERGLQLLIENATHTLGCNTLPVRRNSRTLARGSTESTHSATGASAPSSSSPSAAANTSQEARSSGRLQASS